MRKVFSYKGIAVALAAGMICSFSGCAGIDSEQKVDESSSTVSSGDFAITSVSYTDIPDDIRDMMQEDIGTEGYYLYDTEKDDGSQYVLLTAGEVYGLRMSTDASIEDGEAYIAVTMNEVAANDSESNLCMAVYETNAETVHVNKQALINPYLKVGAKGINTGFIENEGDAYYITPIMADNVMNRSFMYGSVGGELANGLYDYTYEITEDGYEVISATPISSMEKYTTVTNVENGVVTVSLGKSGITMDMTYDITDESMHTLLIDLMESGREGLFTIITKDGGPHVSALKAMRSEVEVG